MNLKLFQNVTSIFLVCKFLTLLLLLFIILINKSSNFKVGLCAIAKLENKYIIQFIEHYRTYGIDNIFLYDNNDVNGENFDFLSNYKNLGFLQIINYRGFSHPQHKIYQECYYNNYKNYKWLLFVDVDEFINLTEHSNIHDFLSQSKFFKCPSIYLNYKQHTDNELIFYDNRSLFERFPTVIQDKSICIGKSLIRGNIENLYLTSSHLLDWKLKRCNGFGNIIVTHGLFCEVPDYKYNFIDHYKFKSTEEFIEKINKGDVAFKNDNSIKYKKIKEYFMINRITSDKINFIANKSRLNASFIKYQLLKYSKKQN